MKSEEVFALLPTISIQYGQNSKYAAVQWNIINVVESLDDQDTMWKYPSMNKVMVKLTSRPGEDDTQFFTFCLNTQRGTVLQDAMNRTTQFIKHEDKYIM